MTITNMMRTLKISFIRLTIEKMVILKFIESIEYITNKQTSNNHYSLNQESSPTNNAISPNINYLRKSTPNLQHDNIVNNNFIDEIIDQAKKENPLTKDSLLKSYNIAKIFENKQKQIEDWSLIAKYNSHKFEEEKRQRKLIEEEKKKFFKETLLKQIIEKQDVERLRKEQKQQLIQETKEGFRSVFNSNNLNKNNYDEGDFKLSSNELFIIF